MAAPSALNNNTAASTAAPSASKNNMAASTAAPSASNDNAATSAAASASNNNTAAIATAPSASNNNVAAPALNDVAIPAAHDGITDVHMSSPIQPLMGSSQTSGGILCGRACGNFPNHADFTITNLELEGPVKGEVYLYLTDQYPGHINFEFLKGDSELVVLVNVVENMVPILNMVAHKFSIIQGGITYIIADQLSGIALGQFDQALEDDDECEWQMSNKQTPELHLLISSYNGPVTGSHYVPSTASRASTVHTPISIPSIPHDSSLSPRQLEIMTALDMDQGLVGTKGSRSSIETIWKRYATITKAISKVGDVDWVFGSKKPVNSKIISVYGGRSTFYEQSKVLQHVKLYPDMKWFAGKNEEAQNDWKGKKKKVTIEESSSSSPQKKTKTHKKSAGGRKHFEAIWICLLSIIQLPFIVQLLFWMALIPPVYASQCDFPNISFQSFSLFISSTFHSNISLATVLFFAIFFDRKY
ncbi:hypothetical protein BYT27DRAFT_7255550 [Phlegmacium glaucopus]|nr:hypothetical protein BYT27DRAFT_7255550 [Phlegmacium glaucopus]